MLPRLHNTIASDQSQQDLGLLQSLISLDLITLLLENMRQVLF